MKERHNGQTGWKECELLFCRYSVAAWHAGFNFLIAKQKRYLKLELIDRERSFTIDKLNN